MVTLLALLAIIGGAVLRFFIIPDNVWDDEDEKDLKELAVYMMSGGVVVILINSWIIRPIMMFIGG